MDVQVVSTSWLVLASTWLVFQATTWNSAAMNMEVLIFLQDPGFNFLDKCPGVELLYHIVLLILSF